MKYWDLDGRFDVIATGSFLGVKGFRAPYVRGIPVGYEEQIAMYPLTFREFIMNAGLNEKVLEYVNKSLREKSVIEKTVHESMRQVYLQYLLVGGMPEAVNVFFQTYDIKQIRNVQVLEKFFLTLPLYSLGFFKNTLQENLIDAVDMKNLVVPE